MFDAMKLDLEEQEGVTLEELQELQQENQNIFLAQNALQTCVELQTLQVQMQDEKDWVLAATAANGLLYGYGAGLDMTQGQEVAMEAYSSTLERLRTLVKSTIGTARANSNKRLLRFTGWFKLFQSSTSRLLEALEKEELYSGDIPMARYMPVLSINGQVNDVRAEFARFTAYWDRVMNNDLRTELAQITAAARQSRQQLSAQDLVAFWANLYCRNLEITIEAPELSPQVLTPPYRAVRSDMFMGNYYNLVKAVPFGYAGFQTGWAYMGPIQRVLPKAVTQDTIRAYPKATILELVNEVANRVNGWTGSIKNGYAAENNVWTAWGDMFDYWSNNDTSEDGSQLEAVLMDFDKLGGEKVIMDFISARNNLVIHLYNVAQAILAFGKGHLPEKK